MLYRAVEQIAYPWCPVNYVPLFVVLACSMHSSEVPLIRRSAPLGGLLALALYVSAFALPALAQPAQTNPFDAEQRRLAQEVARARGVTGILAAPGVLARVG